MNLLYIITEIFKTNNCKLTELNKSIRQHKLYLSGLETRNKLFIDQLKFGSNIPIT